VEAHSSEAVRVIERACSLHAMSKVLRADPIALTLDASRLDLSRVAGEVDVCDHPLPRNGIFVAMMVTNWTFDSSGRLAMNRICWPTWSTSMRGSTAIWP
jgi:hypothetical protein